MMSTNRISPSDAAAILTTLAFYSDSPNVLSVTDSASDYLDDHVKSIYDKIRQGKSSEVDHVRPWIDYNIDGLPHRDLAFIAYEVLRESFDSKIKDRASSILNDSSKPIQERLDYISDLREDLDAPPTKPKKYIKPFHISDIQDRGVHAIPYLIKGLIPKKEPFGIYGPGESFKTFICWELTRAIVEGDSFLELFDVNISGPVVWLDKESGGDRMCMRSFQMGITKEMPINIWTDGLAKHIAIESPRFIHQIGELLSHLDSPPVALIIDSFTRFFHGDENRSAEVGAAMDNLIETSRTYNLSTILIHHTRKFSRDDKSENKYKVRGSGDFINALSSAIYLQNRDGVLCVEPAKTRDSIGFEPFGLELKPDSRYSKNRLKFYHTDIPGKPSTRNELAEDEIIRSLEGAGCDLTLKDVLDKCIPSICQSRGPVMKALNRLEEDKRIEIIRKGKGRGKSPIIKLL
jgi:hypothetical protein